MPMPAYKRRGVVRVDDADGAIVGAGGARHRLLSIPGFALDAQAVPDQERHATLLGSLAASLPRKARLTIVIENRPAGVAEVLAELRGQLAPEPHTPQLGEVGERMLTWWERRLSEPGRRHVARLSYWLLVEAYPAQDGYPDQSEPARLGQAVASLTRQLVAMGLPPTVADAATARAFVERHLIPSDRGDGYVARPGDESFLAYRQPATSAAWEKGKDGATGAGGERWTRTLYLVQPPAETEPGWLRALVAGDSPATLVLHLRGLSAGWERRRQAWRLKLMEGTTGAGGGKDITTRIAATEAEEQATALHRPGYGVVKVGAYLRLEGDTRAQLDARVGAALRAMRDTMHAEPGFGHAHQEPLYRSTLPGYGDRARSTYRWDSVTLGHAWPFLAFNPGTRSAGVPLGTTDAAGDLVTLAFDDPALYNRIGVAVGLVGSGKTGLLLKCALWFLLTGNYATVVSSVDSFAALCAISRGERAMLGGPQSATINVWERPAADDEERRERVRFVCAAVELLLGGLVDLEPSFVDEAVREVYAASESRVPVMADLYDALDCKWRAPGCDPDDRKVYRQLVWKLRPYVKDGQHARLVDGPTSVRLDAPLLAFNTEPLESNGQLRNFAYFAVFAVVDQRRALARRLSRGRDASSADHLTGLDEAWGLLTSPLAREHINRDARKARHGGNCVLFASQQIKDLVGNADAETFFTQASFKALFSVEDNGQQTDGNPKLWLERMLNLTPEEVDQAQAMSGEKGAYMPCFVTRRDRRHPRDLHGVVRVELTSDEAALFASDTDDITARDWWTARAGGDVWGGIKLANDGDPLMEATAS